MAVSDQVGEFTEFASGCAAGLFRTAWLLTGDWYLAEDLVQETLGKVYRKWRSKTPIDDPGAYARTVLVRTHISFRRRRSSGERPAPAVSAGVTSDPDSDLRLTLLAGLAELSARDRAVLVLRYWEDRSVMETAAVLGLSAGAVRSRSFRALERLRAVLADTNGDLTALGH